MTAGITQQENGSLFSAIHTPMTGKTTSHWKQLRYGTLIRDHGRKQDNIPTCMTAMAILWKPIMPLFLKTPERGLVWFSSIITCNLQWDTIWETQAFFPELEVQLYFTGKNDEWDLFSGFCGHNALSEIRKKYFALLPCFSRAKGFPVLPKGTGPSLGSGDLDAPVNRYQSANRIDHR